MYYLTNEEIISLAPAAGAQAPIRGVSERYSFIPTIEAVDLLRDVGWFPVGVHQSQVRKEERDGYQKHMIRFVKDGLSFGGERIDLVLYNSHDRGCSFQLIASVWRKICGNGLMVASDFANFTHKHIGFNPDEFVNSANKIVAVADNIAESVEMMKTIELTRDERSIYAQAAHSLVYEVPEQAPIRPEQLLQERRYDDNGKDLWTTFNVVQENLMKGGLTYTTKSGRKRRSRPVKSLDRNLRLNKALWLLTEKMAELKS
ncbi:protein of unknown function DUF932 [Dissulfuribacter thermophilus]|uniref:DUF945 domain-containing protein n=1 Tax=Dissulfuribacter thermophilus TaxID=1156395 RepID=A0A1B9F5V5_9BACT|nr:DUF932 domain-containing protein [Dissulfuribacter thermophilus]OCC15319.1 protein of unknown function DUF932 [Dissulfuribacter thermophilus]